MTYDIRYYYAIVTCDTVEAAAQIYSELQGTELERSANVFDLSFVPDDMTFDQDCRYVMISESLCGDPYLFRQRRGIRGPSDKLQKARLRD
jgi:hypothetical protein